MLISMSKSFNRISDSIIIPKASREDFLPVSAMPAVKGLIELAGLSELTAGYRVSRVRPEFALLLHSFAGDSVWFETASVEMLITPGSTVLVPSGISYRYGSDHDWTLLWFHLAADSISGSELQTGRANHDLRRLSQSCISEASRAASDSVVLDAYGVSIERLIQRELKGEFRGQHTHASALADLWMKVEQSLHYPWSIEDLAAHAGLSSVQFRRVVRTIEGCSPLEKLTRLRMNRAKLLLTSSAYPLKVIAGMIGYATPFSFSKCFARHVGFSPKAFRIQSQSMGKG
jgi:AraC-like DNA-binding protein